MCKLIGKIGKDHPWDNLLRDREFNASAHTYIQSFINYQVIKCNLTRIPSTYYNYIIFSSEFMQDIAQEEV